MRERLKNIVYGIRYFFKTMGLIEQAQVVASTAVVVAMGTIITARIAIGKPFETLDFINVLTVGIIGFVSIFFALKYGRILEQQRREVLELNTIAEAVNHSVELDYVLQSALVKVMELMHADSGWIYLLENGTLVLKQRNGSSQMLLPTGCSIDDESASWVRRPGLLSVNDPAIIRSTTSEFRNDRIHVLVSIPLVRQSEFAGVLVIGSTEIGRFEAKNLAVIQAFGNQISAALNNAYLFEQVRQSEKRYADLYEYSPDMYHSVSRDGIVVSCNETETSLLGMSKDAIVGKPLSVLYPPAQHHHVEANLRKIFEQGKELHGVEEQLQRCDGTLVDVSVNTSLVRDSEGRPVVARMVLRDITEKKKMEAKILQAQKIDSIGNLAGGIAHDFNNILTAILGSASIMRRRIERDQRLTKYVDLIESTSRRGAAVTRQLLTFARKSNPHVDRIDINAIIEQTIRLFEVSAPRTIHVKCTLAPEPIVVEADEGQIQQALLNLCLNSRDAMPNGGILVINCSGVVLDETSAEQFTDAKPGAYAMVSIADSGAGIPENILPRIFEPFFTTKEHGKGTGLGLSVVYGVVKSHNGFINVASEVNSGTIFTIYLPRVFAQPTIQIDRPRGRSELVGGTERILIIEDEISVGEVGSEILSDLGYRIEVAHNGREALDRLTTDPVPFDLIILDMNMPRMGGRTTFDHIKRLFPAMKIVVCSGYSATMLDDGKFTESIDGFVQKPYEIDDFAFKVRNVLDAPPRSAILANQTGS